MIKKNLPTLGEKVNFVRIKPADNGAPAELIKGEGTVVGLIIGITRRVQVMVKDAETSANKAWTLEPFCINPSDEDANAYIDHHMKLQAAVDKFNAEAQACVTAGNIEVDQLNAEMFGPPMEI